MPGRPGNCSRMAAHSLCLPGAMFLTNQSIWHDQEPSVISYAWEETATGRRGTHLVVTPSSHSNGEIPAFLYLIALTRPSESCDRENEGFPQTPHTLGYQEVGCL